MAVLDQAQLGGITYDLQDTKAQAMIAPAFSTSQAYSAGDSVTYNGALYTFTADHAAGAWIGTDAATVPGGVAGEVADLKSALDDLAHRKPAYITEDDEIFTSESIGQWTTGGTPDPSTPNPSNKRIMRWFKATKAFQFWFDENAYNATAVYICTFANDTISTANNTGKWKSNDQTYPLPTVNTKGTCVAGDLFVLSYYNNTFTPPLYINISNDLKEGDFQLNEDVELSETQIDLIQEMIDDSSGSDIPQEAIDAAEYVADNLNIQTVHDILISKGTHAGKRVDTTAAGNSESVYLTDEYFNASDLNECNPSTAYTVFTTENNQRFTVFYQVHYYDNGYNWLSKKDNISTFTTPSTAKYFILVARAKADGQGSGASEAVHSFSSVHVLNGAYTFAQVLDVFPIAPNAIKKTKSLTGYEGVKWMAIGDSITEHNFRAMYNYLDYIRKELLLTTYNCGISGSGYGVHDTGDSYDASMPPFYQRIDGYAALYQPDIITVFGGINDLMFSNKQLGEITDTTNTTIMGCVYLCKTNIETYFPHVPFAILSPLPTYACNTEGVYADYSPSDQTNKEYLFVQKLSQFCDYYGIPFLDLYNKMGFRPWVESFREYFTKFSATALADGLHPNAYGHKLIYPKIREFLKTLI